MTEKIHFVGIGGAGMSGLARIYLRKGYRVSGSDIKESKMTALLRREGAEIFIGHYQDNINGAGMVVVSSAILGSNPELSIAEKRGIPVLARAELLAQLSEGKTTIAISGTHGKTTTTSMAATVLSDCGYDPTFIIGGELNDIGSNARFGNGDFLVAEADESDGSLLYLHPQYNIITNVEADHLDYYGTYENVLRIFTQFLSQRDPQGENFVCGDDDNLKKVAVESGLSYVAYGLSPDNLVHARNVRLGRMSSFFEAYKNQTKLGNITLQVPGAHNVRNALGVIALAERLEIDMSDTAKSLAEFTGVQRRFQIIGRSNGIDVVDDYAHHPTEVEATIKAAHDGSWNRIITVFQPHRYSRTQYFYSDFGRCFNNSDIVVITDVYGAGEKPIPGVSSKLIVDSVLESKSKAEVIYLPHKSDIKPYLLSHARPGDLVLLMGAGDIGGLGPDLCSELEAFEQEENKAIDSCQ